MEIESQPEPSIVEPAVEEAEPSLAKMGKDCCRGLRGWLQEIEMGLVWGIAGVSIILFVFAAIWFIDPALLTLVLQFRQAKCVTEESAVLVGISNCSWTSCRLGCTREVFQCWQVQVRFEFIPEAQAYRPPWASLSAFKRGSVYQDGFEQVIGDDEVDGQLARLYPNVRGCGYPPDLDCDEFYEVYSPKEQTFDCWVSTMDTTIAMTSLDLERAKEEVIYSLIPLFLFIVSVLYAFCRLGVFTICNPLRTCPRARDRSLSLNNISPEKLFEYKKGLVARKAQSMSFTHPSEDNPPTGPDASMGLDVTSTIHEHQDEAADSDPSLLDDEVRVAETYPRLDSVSVITVQPRGGDSEVISVLAAEESPKPPSVPVARRRREETFALDESVDIQDLVDMTILPFRGHSESSPEISRLGASRDRRRPASDSDSLWSFDEQFQRSGKKKKS